METKKVVVLIELVHRNFLTNTGRAGVMANMIWALSGLFRIPLYSESLVWLRFNVQTLNCKPPEQFTQKMYSSLVLLILSNHITAGAREFRYQRQRCYVSQLSQKLLSFDKCGGTRKKTVLHSKHPI